MKAFILSFILIFGLVAANHGKPINDIYSIKEPVIAEESNIDDIPFNTWKIAVDAMLEGDELMLEEEPFINDIPFDTRKIACEYLLREMFETTGQVNVNDIPFNTERVYCEQMAKLLTEEYRQEKMVNDLPDMKGYTICTNDCGFSNCFAIKVKSQKHPIFRQRRISDYNYTIIYPVKIELPEIEFNTDDRDNEIIFKPGFSL